MADPPASFGSDGYNSGSPRNNYMQPGVQPPPGQYPGPGQLPKGGPPSNQFPPGNQFPSRPMMPNAGPVPPRFGGPPGNVNGFSMPPTSQPPTSQGRAPMMNGPGGDSYTRPPFTYGAPSSGSASPIPIGGTPPPRPGFQPPTTQGMPPGPGQGMPPRPGMPRVSSQGQPGQPSMPPMSVGQSFPPRPGMPGAPGSGGPPPRPGMMPPTSQFPVPLRPGMPPTSLQGNAFSPPSGPSMPPISSMSTPPTSQGPPSANQPGQPPMPTQGGQFRPPGPPTSMPGGLGQVPRLPAQGFPPRGPPQPGTRPPLPAQQYPPGAPQGGPPRGPPPPSGVPPQGPGTGGPPPRLPIPQVSEPTPNDSGAEELPVPYHGHATYSHQVGGTASLAGGLTPGSAPVSRKSSRAPSPISNHSIDAMEGQFSGAPPAIGGQPPTPQSPQAGQEAAARPTITGRRQYPVMPGYAGDTGSYPQAPPNAVPPPSGFPAPTATQPGYYGNQTQPQPVFQQQQTYQQQPIQQPASQPGYGGTGSLASDFSKFNLTDPGRIVNVLQERRLIPPDGVETIKPSLNYDYKKVNCNPDIFRCTLSAIPQTSALLNKARLPLGILIHPFKDLSQLPVIQSSVIVRCRSCRTYINPFVYFVDQKRWKCNLCYRVNELPEEFSFDPVSKTYGDPQRRPEVRSATIEFIAPSEYMLRPPQPAVYLFLLDVSFNAVETGYLSLFCSTLLEELDKLPGDARTQVGFLAFDRSLYFFNLAEGLSQPQMLIVPDLEDPFLPCPDNLLVNLTESRELVVDLLNQLPSLFQDNKETGSALGAAVTAAFKLMSSTGGRITVMQTTLPTVGPGALQLRENSQGSGKNIAHLGPATDFYKKLALECSGQQVAVDLFLLNGQYADIASLSCMSKYSGGCVYHYPSYHSIRNPGMVDAFETDLRRYLTRKIGFEAVMRIRCTRGLSIHTFHGNFFVRSTDLLSLPNINPDAGFGMQMSIEDSLTETSTVCFQAALLYTSSKGERRIRVHTLCLPVTNNLSDIFASADQQAIAGLLAKMAVDRSMTSSIGDARDAMINAVVDAIQAYSAQIPPAQRVGALCLPYTLRLLPLFVLAMLKSIVLRQTTDIPLDKRGFGMLQGKCQPLSLLLQSFYPHMYAVHALDDKDAITKGNMVVPKTPLLQLSSANLDRHGAYLLDAGHEMYLMVGAAISDQFCQEVLDQPNFACVPEGMCDLPELDNPTSERLRNFVNHLMDSRPHGMVFLVLKEDSKQRQRFFQYMVEDRTESSMSYYEFLQFLQSRIKS